MPIIFQSRNDQHTTILENRPHSLIVHSNAQNSNTGRSKSQVKDSIDIMIENKKRDLVNLKKSNYYNHNVFEINQSNMQ